MKLLAALLVLSCISNAQFLEAKTMYNDYTVVLLYPEYATGDFGADVYVDHVRARTINEAVRIVRQRAVNKSDKAILHNDLRMVLVLYGNVKVLADATWSTQ